MSIEHIHIIMQLTWFRPMDNQNQFYQWGAPIPSSKDPTWSRKNLIYRWLRNSDGSVAYIGESEQSLRTRIKQYIKPGPTQNTNKKVRDAQQKLTIDGDFFYLEYTDQIKGYDLIIQRERKLAEALLQGYYRPYLQFQ